MKDSATAIETVTHGDFAWRVDAAHHADVEPFLEDPEGFLERTPTRIVKRNSVRTVHFVRIGSRDYYVKRYVGGDATEQVKAKLGESKAEREWRIMSRGRAAGLPVPVPAAMGERRRRGRLEASYLATLSIDDTVDLVPFIEEHLLDDTAARESFMRDLGGAVWTMHEAGLFHRDLHSGNVLIQHPDRTPDAWRIHWIDLHRGSWRPGLGAASRRWNLAFLLHSTSRVTTPEDRAACIDGYIARADGADGGLGDRAALLEWVEARILRFERRRLKSRSKRCIVQSSKFRHEAIVAREGVPAGTLYYARDFGRENAERAIAAFANGALLKETKRTVVRRVDLDGDALVVKEYRPRLADHANGGRGFRAWRNGNALIVRAVPVATPHAYLRRRGGGGFLVMALAPGKRLDHAIIELAERHGERSAAYRAALRSLRDASARLVRSMHDRGIYHGDLKACNVFVEPEPDAGANAGADARYALTLVDYDRVSTPDRSLNQSLRAANLAQLHAAVTTHVGRAARVAWYRRYANDARWEARRAMFDAIARLCAEKIVVGREPIE